MARRQAEKSAQTKYELMEAAKKLFVERGFENTTVADIVDMAGYSVGAFYRHFSSKENMAEELFVKLSIEAADVELEQLKKMNSIYEVLETMFEIRSAEDGTNKEVACLYNMTLRMELAGPDPKTTEKYQTLLTELLKQISPNAAANEIDTYANILMMLLNSYWVSRFNRNVIQYDSAIVKKALFTLVDSFKDV